MSAPSPRAQSDGPDKAQPPPPIPRAASRPSDIARKRLTNPCQTLSRPVKLSWSW
jgi:hypothetical protein